MLFVLTAVAVSSIPGFLWVKHKDEALHHLISVWSFASSSFQGPELMDLQTRATACISRESYSDHKLWTVKSILTVCRRGVTLNDMCISYKNIQECVFSLRQKHQFEYIHVATVYVQLHEANLNL